MDRARAKVAVRGAVQGVGFRPFVYRLASELHLHGWVLNSAQGVFVEIEGARDSVRQFLLRLEKEKPPRAFIQSAESSYLDVAGYEKFEIGYSDDAGAKTAFISPDIAACVDCIREIFDPHDRRHRYPFTNCTNCGPRFTIIEALPYDRPNTSMKKFEMCEDCEREYHDPNDRRFHAQPNACARCGPRLQLWNVGGENIAENDEALIEAAAAVGSGRILALKGIGGFQLIVDARNEVAVLRLRERKHREEKPFASMVPALKAARENCEISELEERLLLSPEAPIVLLKQSAGRDSLSAIDTSVAPGNPCLGMMLPNTPLHHLLMRELQFPIVATSGNLSDEPICIDEHEALERLRGIADLFLVHDRPIVRHVDDSIVRVIQNRESVLRRARGYAPLPITLKS
ncbi:MAG: carbamoyltransferase HypF, partial [Verrucomicrobiota bacterium]|nr:carbamoyltransferase HypF [Verrucomicrobiota bacterium]